MNKTIRSLSAFAVIVSLSACQTLQNAPKQTGGTLLGAGLGALAGSQVGSGKGQMAAVAAGALLGGFFGGEAGKSLDRADNLYAARSAQSSLEYNRVGEAASWSNPDSGNTGSYTPTKSYVSPNGQNCRDFESTVLIDGRAEKARGTACRQPDGSWRIVADKSYQGAALSTYR